MEYLPRFIVMKPDIFSQYVCYERGTEHGQIFCSGQDVFNAYSKIEVEPSKNSEKHCHLRFCHSNRYWSRCKEDEWAVVAVSDQPPEEDTSKPSCTLFEPSIEEGGRLVLTHVQSRLIVQKNDDSNHRLSFWRRNPGLAVVDTKFHLFTYLDWDELVYFPKLVLFKGPNNKFLKGIHEKGHNYLQFSSIDGNDGMSVQEVMPESDGHVRIKSLHHGKFWRRDKSDWIMADSSDGDGRDVDTRFWPVKVDDRTIALLNAGNNLFVKRLTADDRTDCLCAFVAEISEETRWLVKEPVTGSFYDVKFRMEDARVFGKEPYVVSYVVGDNNTNKAATLTHHFSVELTAFTTFTRMTSLNIEDETTFKTGIPFIEEGKVNVSGEVTENLEWGRAREEKRRPEPPTFAVEVPPKSRVRANYVATKAKYSIPFSYTRRNESGEFEGICYGVDYYSFRFEHLEPKPL